MSYEYVHESEKITIEHQPDLGMDDVSKCLPGWVKKFCDAFEKGNGIFLTNNAVSNLAHTLIAARRRQHRLIEERDASLEDARMMRERLDEARRCRDNARNEAIAGVQAEMAELRSKAMKCETRVIDDHEFKPRFSDPSRCGHVVNGNWNSSTADVDYCNASADCHVRPRETGLTGTSWMSDMLSLITPGFVWVVLCVIASAILFGVARW